MTNISRKELSQSIAQLMPRIIQGVQLEFLLKRTITQTQFLVMVAIHSQGPCAMNTLAKNMHVSMPTMSGVVDRLVQRGLVIRIESKEDRRKVMVELSRKGKDMIVQFQGAVSQRWSEVLEGLGQNDLDSFHKIIMKLTQQLQSKP